MGVKTDPQNKPLETLDAILDHEGCGGGAVGEDVENLDGDIGVVAVAGHKQLGVHVAGKGHRGCERREGEGYHVGALLERALVPRAALGQQEVVAAQGWDRISRVIGEGSIAALSHRSSA